MIYSMPPTLLPAPTSMGPMTTSFLLKSPDKKRKRGPGKDSKAQGSPAKSAVAAPAPAPSSPTAGTFPSAFDMFTQEHSKDVKKIPVLQGRNKLLEMFSKISDKERIRYETIAKQERTKRSVASEVVALLSIYLLSINSITF